MVPSPLPEHKPDTDHFIRFEPTTGDGRVAIYYSVAGLVERFRGSRFAFCASAPLDLCVAAFLADLGGTVDATGVQRLLAALEGSRR